ncbi:hypothetical protein V7O66_13865 [Methanolobus sp. ZRKC3]|uniref:hypothetical protein n=1 Tax=Methanolobus sp. ZRKC3 TaxID=3125786 RepID=UPI00324B8FF3
MTYAIYGAWWNGQAFDTVTKCAKTKKEAIGLASLLLRECNPKQIWIVDEDNKEPIPNDLAGIACSLNKVDEKAGTQTTLGVDA